MARRTADNTKAATNEKDDAGPQDDDLSLTAGVESTRAGGDRDSTSSKRSDLSKASSKAGGAGKRNRRQTLLPSEDLEEKVMAMRERAGPTITFSSVAYPLWPHALPSYSS